MRYNSAKGFLFLAVMILLVVMVIFSLIAKAYTGLVIISLVIILFLWIWFDTYYVIQGKELLYKSAFIKGVISIESIYEIERNKTMYAGLKPALAMKGLVVKYNKYDDIYLSPKDADDFIAALKEVNPNINII
ncbi:PH domain-containing protein [Mucilaginibacter sp. S1162]|uniref:PH domain-containing protein n=1 Tax=Mucilaginibacter humi TaxID=2732510 RepID=A0ABX1W333_9SPHI|nr:PH domain-containing protein [Mucilaginibacter humi]NNU34071.1 PH domain-containing protein [Mucilaginibacter humi]